MNEQFLTIGNELDQDGWALIAPYGEHPKSRVAKVNGVPTEQRFLQVLDNESADKLLDKENSMFSRLKRAVVGIPVWKGHPDLREHSPETLSNAAPRLKLGTVGELRKSDRGMEARFTLDNDGAAAVQAGYKFPSALWLVLPNGETRNGAAVVHPFKLLSVGLTPHPNISGVESLANSSQNSQQIELMLREQIIGALIGRSVALPNDATDQQLVQVIANGGHPWNGNQYAEGSGGTTASNRASRDSAAASGAAMKSGSKEDHLKAETAHRHAAAEANKSGNRALAMHHDVMADMHHSMGFGKA
jgi:hypothetical protein